MPDNTGTTLEIPRNPDGTFPKGFSGNPSGPPKGYKHMTTKIMEAIEKVSEDGATTEDKALVKKLLEQAKKGDMQAMKLIFNYVDGLPMQNIDANINGNINLTVVNYGSSDSLPLPAAPVSAPVTQSA